MRTKSFFCTIGLGLLLIACPIENVRAQSCKVFPINKIPNRYDKGGGIVYTLPKTNLKIEIIVEKTQRIKGPFATEAHLVNLTNVVLQNETKYRIKDMRITEQGLPDETQSYILIPEKDLYALNLAPNGMIEHIAFYNIDPPQPKKHRKNSTSESLTDVSSQNIVSPYNITPIYEKTFLEKGMYANKGNVSALEIAEKIKHLKDYQMDILSGSTEGTYLNTTVDFMYKQLDEIIAGYIALFTGVETTFTETYTFNVVPERSLIEKDQNSIPICTFSEKTGIGAISESNSAPMVYLDIQEPAKRSVYGKNVLLRSDSGNNGVGLVYRIPKLTSTSLSYGDKKYHFAVSIAQYGDLQTLVGNKFRAIFDPQTGNLIHYEQK